MDFDSNVKIDHIQIHNDKKTKNVELVTFVEQYAKKVLDFSSQYGSNISISYTAENITGNPTKFPDYGDYPQSFVMRTYGNWWNDAPSRLTDFMIQNHDLIDSHDYIDIEFHQKVYPIRVSIYETYNPGSIIKIWARNDLGHWFLLWSGLPQKVCHKSRIFSPPLKIYKFKTKVLRLEFNHGLLDYYTEIDGVLLIGTSELILPINHYKSISALLEVLNDSFSEDDACNLTPDTARINYDLQLLKNNLHKLCFVPKIKIFDIIPSSLLISQTNINFYKIPPIEKALDNFQKFLKQDLPRLISDNENGVSSMCLYLEKNGCQRFTDEKNCHKNCGSFSLLSDEMILKILNNLDLKSLSRVCRVNKYFHNIAQDALLYTSLNLKPYWYCLDAHALRVLIPRCQYLQKLDLSWCGNDNLLKTQNVTEYLNNCGHNLTNLRLNCCRFVNDLIAERISAMCKNLKELCLRNCKSITATGFNQLSKLKNLERLELYGTSIETRELCIILRNNIYMRHLNLASIQSRVNMDEVAEQIANSCIYLESIDFWKCHTLTSVGIRWLSRCSRLREVDFGWCVGINTSDDCLRTFFICCNSLEKVFLTAIRGLSDRDIEPLLFCQQLQQLDLLGARSLTSEICIRFLLCCPKLKLIDLSFCDTISNIKINEWRSLYPHVSIKRNNQVNNIHYIENIL